MRCDVCKKGYFLNPNETNCDGQFSVIPPPAKGLRTLMYAVVGCLDGSGLLWWPCGAGVGINEGLWGILGLLVCVPYSDTVFGDNGEDCTVASYIKYM